MKRGREIVGTVLSNNMKKTVVVMVKRRARDARLEMIVVHRRKLKAHDEKGECRVGDEVLLAPSRPLSREKRWCVTKILRQLHDPE